MARKKIRKNRSRAAVQRRRSSRSRAAIGIIRMTFAGIGIICLSLLFVLGYDIVTQGTLFAARRIEVTGNQVLSESQVLALAGIEPEANIFSVNLALARKRLLSSGWVAAAEVGREIPDRLTVRIKEHEPVALLELGKKYIMSREGTVVKEWEETDPAGLPLVTGLTYADLPLADAPDQTFSSLMQVIDIARNDQGALSLANLERIDVDQDLGITLYAKSSVKTAWIGYQNFAEKFTRLARLLDHLNRQPTDQALDVFDLESDSRIVAGPFPEVLSDKSTRRS